MTPVTGRARVGDLELAYDVFGTRGRPLVLVMGIGAQRILWDAGLCAQFVDAGFHVVRFDHRDIGESTQLDAPVPHPGRVLARRMLGLAVEAPYDLADMAADVAGLIDALGLGRAHVVGTSLGGMVGQQLAIHHASHLRSLTTIMTTPGSRRYVPQPRALKALFPRRPTTAAEAGVMVETMFATIGSPAWPIDRERLRALGATAFERGLSPRGFLRHFAAVMASEPWRTKLRTSPVPTLVIHGTRDPMFPLRAGRDLSRLFPDATWLPIAGMGHDLPSPMWPVFVRAIARHAERADARARV